MTAVPFDTLAWAQKLRDGARMSPEQAEGVSKALSEELSGADLVTKEHLENRLRDLEQRLIIKLGAMIIALGGFLAAIKFMGH